MKRSSLKFETLESRIVLAGVGLGGAPELTVATVIPPSDNAGRDLQVLIPAHAQQLAPGVFSLGVAVDPATGKTVEGLAFVQYRKGFGHNPNSPPNHGGGGGGNGGGGNGGGEKCFEVLAKGAKWKTVEDYMVAPDNNDELSDTDVFDAIDAATDTWNAEVAGDIFGDRIDGAAVDGADTVAPDDKNEVLFGDLGPGVVAVNITWGIFRGPPSGRELVEWDQVYNHVEFDFGVNGEANKMDLLGVGAHEVGHAGGLNHPSDTCTEETMYAFVANGETKKRDLNAGDIEGIQSLYGAANAVTASQISSGIGAAIESAFDGRPFDTLPEDAPPVGETPSGPPSFEQLPEDAPPVEHLPQFAPSHTNEDTIDLVMFHGKSNGTLDELFGTDELFGGLA